MEEEVTFREMVVTKLAVRRSLWYKLPLPVGNHGRAYPKSQVPRESGVWETGRESPQEEGMVFGDHFLIS